MTYHIDKPINDVNGQVERYEVADKQYGWLGPSNKYFVRKDQMFRFLDEPTRIFIMRTGGFEEITKSLSPGSYEGLLQSKHWILV